jgi:hypothetical protein
LNFLKASRKQRNKKTGNVPAWLITLFQFLNISKQFPVFQMEDCASPSGSHSAFAVQSRSQWHTVVVVCPDSLMMK